MTKKFYGNRPELVSTVGRNGVLKTYGRGVVTIDATLDPKRDKTKARNLQKTFLIAPLRRLPCAVHCVLVA